MEEFLKFAADVFAVDVKTISMKTEYRSIPQWDSLAHIRMIAEIEDRYGVIIPFEKVGDICTLADFYSYVQTTQPGVN